MACITTTEGRRDAARDVRMEKVASTGVTAAARTDRSVLELVDLRFASTGIRRGDRRLDLSDRHARRKRAASCSGRRPGGWPTAPGSLPLSRLERSPHLSLRACGAPACRGDKDVHRLEAGLTISSNSVLGPAGMRAGFCTRVRSEGDPHAGACSVLRIRNSRSPAPPELTARRIRLDLGRDKKFTDPAELLPEISGRDARRREFERG